MAYDFLNLMSQVLDMMFGKISYTKLHQHEISEHWRHIKISRGIQGRLG